MSERVCVADGVLDREPQEPPQGQGLIDLTRKIAGAILQRAGQDAQRIRSEASEAGYREGLEEARRQATAEREAFRRELVAQVGSRLLEVEQEYNQNWSRLEKIVEQNLLEALFLLAGNSLGRVLRESPSVLAEAMREAVQDLDPRQRIQIRMHPEDLERIVGLSERPGLEHCELQSDSSIERGGFVASSDAGDIDGQWSARVALWGELLAPGA